MPFNEPDTFECFNVILFQILLLIKFLHLRFPIQHAEYTTKGFKCKHKDAHISILAVAIDQRDLTVIEGKKTQGESLFDHLINI